MDAERWQQVNQLFDAAVDVDEDGREAFVRQQAGDDHELAVEVLKLLGHDAHAAADNFLKPNAVNIRDQLPDNKVGDLIGRQLGPYLIKKRIGEGGMGQVYLATRTEDFSQRVAIKLLKRGMDTDDIIRRFRQEIRVLAALGQHPNIARLIDAGTTDDGLPYLVMEFVEGLEIDAYCDKNQLTIRQRLELFQSVCTAVHFAHQHTIIHRDIKPSNILVTKDGRAKLIDFGIAKLTAPELQSDTALHTATEYRVLTPEYASPEQVRAEPLTTASDVYSLGIVLYQLLTGSRPYAFENRAPKVVEQVVCEQQPIRPSTLIGNTTKKQHGQQHAQELCRRRQAALPQLKRTLRGDLDNIAMMALRKEPRYRYASAGQFAVDIGRYLEGDVVVARKLNAGKRFMRTCQAYPVATSAVIAVLVASTFGLAYLSKISRQLVQSEELESAAEQAQILYHGHKYYTNVLRTISDQSPEVAGQLKPPATFTIELFEYLNQSRAGFGTMARLVSDYPFKNRTGRAPPDQFERDALDYLANSDADQFHRFESVDGQPFLRYAIGMRMEQSCCDCHNTHVDSTKTDWRPGQVRGVLEVMRPLATGTQRTQEGLRSAVGWIAGIVVGVFGLVAVMLRMLPR